MGSSVRSWLAVVVLGACGGGGSGGSAPDQVAHREATLQLNRIAKAARSALADAGGFPTGSAALTPEQPCCKTGGTCRPNPGAWARPPWDDLSFSVDEPHRFQYTYEGTATSFVATAVGDPNCDGKVVTYELRGSVVDGNAMVTETTRGVD